MKRLGHLGNVVDVQWKDTYGGSGWRDYEDIKDWDRKCDGRICHTFGLVLGDDPKFLTLAGSVDCSKEKIEATDHRTRIPKRAVRHVRVLQKRKGKR